MKKLLLFIVVECLIIVRLQAQVYKTVNVTNSGTLSTLLSSTELSSTTNLTVTGTIDARDFVTMRDYMPVLANLDLTNAMIVQYIGKNGTYYNSNSIVTYNPNTIPEYAFYNYNKTNNLTLISISLPNSLLTIGNNSFWACFGLKTVIMPSTLQTIGDYAFQYSNITGFLNLPSSLITLGNYSFSGCEKISSVTIPSSITKIPKFAFSGCYTLSSIHIPTSVSVIDSDAFSSCHILTNVILPSSIKRIEYSAFYDDGALSTFIIPSSVTSIGSDVFTNCYGLISVTIPSSVTSIGEGVFFSCNNLKTIYNLAATPVNLPSMVFVNVDTLNCKLYVPKGSKTAYQNSNQWNAFINIIEIDDILLSDSVLTLQKAEGSKGCITVYSNTNWTANSNQSWLTITPDVGTNGNTTITFTATANTGVERTATVSINGTNLSSRTITITQASNNAIVSKTLNVTIPGTVALLLNTTEFNSLTNLTITGTINARDFVIFRDSLPNLHYLNLQNATIAAYSGKEGPDGIYTNNYMSNTIPYTSFYQAKGYTSKTSLKTIIFPSTITSIGMFAFVNCTGLDSIIIPNSVTSIQTDAFAGCSHLSYIYIPASVSSIGYYSFLDCLGITVDQNNQQYSSIDNILFNKAHTELIYCANSKTNYTIPNSIDSLAADAFQDCNKLTSITLSPSIKTLSTQAFGGCTGLTTFTIPATIKSIQEGVFIGDSNLTSVTIPSSVKSIGSQAFYFCKKLKSIYTYSVSPINLKSSNNVFTGIDTTTCILYVPYGSTNAYKKANQWSAFTNILEMNGMYISDSVISISNNKDSKAYFTIASNFSWTASSDQSWLTVSPISNSFGSTTVTVTTSENIGSDRSATITISGADFTSRIITVTQSVISSTINSDTSLFVKVSNAGTLATELSSIDLNSITNITITGNIDARDLETMKIKLPILRYIDLSKTNIVSYSGRLGTMGNIDTSYKANTIPTTSFWSNNYDTISILLPLSISTIEAFAFSGLYLDSITIPLSVTTIADYAFQGCNLNSILFSTSSTLTYIGIQAFVGNSNLKNVTIPSTVLEIGDRAFEGCRSLTEFDFASSSTLKYISSNLFAGCQKLKSITIPTSVKSIRNSAFAGCSQLSSLTLNFGLDTIENNAFSGCNNLTGTLTIPSSVSFIGENAFSGDVNLFSISIPSTVKTIANYAFYGAGSYNANKYLQSIYTYSKTPVDLSSVTSVFSGIDTTKCILYVPKGSSTAYKNSNQWKAFSNIVEMHGLSLSDTLIILSKNTGSNADVTISSDTSWIAYTYQSWISVTPNKVTTGNSNLLITAEANTSLTSRTAEIIVSANGIPSQTIKIIQEAGNGTDVAIITSDKKHFYISGNTIYFDNNKSSVYSLLGQCISNGNMNVNLSNGCYIIKTPTSTDRVVIVE